MFNLREISKSQDLIGIAKVNFCRQVFKGVFDLFVDRDKQSSTWTGWKFP